MKLLRFTDTRHRWALAFTACVLGAYAVGCGGAQQTDDSEGRVVGEPPSETSDPFRIMNTPEEAERAESSGYIGENKRPSEGTTSTEEGDEASSRDVAVEASKATPPEDSEDEEAPPSAGEIQCFSCVRICPIRSGSGGAQRAECGGKQRDVICGWGVHQDRGTARKLARAECDGALEMARKMRTWSRIEGACPSATCRSGGS